MDELTLLRRLDADTPAPTESALTGAFDALDARMAAAVRPAPRSRPALRRGLVLTGFGLAAATAVAVVAVDLGPAPSASALTRTLQTAAASAAAGGAGGDGTRTHSTLLVTYYGRDGRTESGVLFDRSSTLQRQDGSDVWVRTSQPQQPVRAWGPDAWRLLAQARQEAADEKTTVERSDASKWFWDQPNSTSPAAVAALPRDPEALSRKLGGVTNADSALQPNAERAIDAASDLLGSGLADAELQAATYRALELVPGLALKEHAADLDGRAGVAIGTTVSAGRQRIDIVIDPATGTYLGRTETNLTAENGAPAGTAFESSAVYPE